MSPLPVPAHFDADRAGEVWRVPYQQRAEEAVAWAREHSLPPASDDRCRVCLLAIDVQNTFCIPGFELYVGGRSGTGAVDDNRRLCRFLYRNLDLVTHVVATLDTHRPIQIFHSLFLVDRSGEHPAPHTVVTAEEVRRGDWRIDPAACRHLGLDLAEGERLLRHYADSLSEARKYDLTIWPFHALLGGIGHALVSAVEEAIFFHGVARRTQATLHVKGDRPLTEHYSAFGPEVAEGPDGEPLAPADGNLLDELLGYDAILVAGQAKSHCVAWTVTDLLAAIGKRDRRLAGKVYLLEDCTSPVVVPGVVDYTDGADAAFRRFSEAGVHLVRTTEPVGDWPAFPSG